MNWLYSTTDKMHATVLVALDILAAFDTVNQDVLIDLLNLQFGFVMRCLSGCDHTKAAGSSL